MTFTLDSRLEKDTYRVGSFQGSILLLMKNALFPWFIIVPDTDQIEFYQLDGPLQHKILAQINALSQFLHATYSIDKLNIGMIGNIVPQLHIHVIGRQRADACWPNVVWGTKEFRAYQDNELAKLREQLKGVAGLFLESTKV